MKIYNTMVTYETENLVLNKNYRNEKQNTDIDLLGRNYLPEWIRLRKKKYDL